MKETKHQLQDWIFQFKESGLATSQELDHITQHCRLFRPPTIVFKNSICLISHAKSDINILYNATEALKFINFQTRQKLYVKSEAQPQINTISYIPEKLFVKHAEHWKSIQKPKDIQITEIKESSDSFFLTPFKGHVTGNVKVEKSKQNVIPLQKLGPHNPITFYNQGSLYEDELDDNGLIQYDYKFRTMANSWFGLIRNYARIDEVTIIIMDIRIYWQQGWNKIARQFMVKKATWQQLKNKQFQFGVGWTMNPNQSHIVYPFLNEQFVDNEYLHFS